MTSLLKTLRICWPAWVRVLLLVCLVTGFALPPVAQAEPSPPCDCPMGDQAGDQAASADGCAQDSPDMSRNCAAAGCLMGLTASCFSPPLAYLPTPSVPLTFFGQSDYWPPITTKIFSFAFKPESPPPESGL